MGAEYNSLKTGLDRMVIDIKNYLSSIQASVKSVDKENLTIINELRKFRTEINQYLDKRGKELLTEIDQNKRKSMTLLIKLEANCQDMELATEKLRLELQAQDNNCNQLFVFGTRALKELANLRSGLGDIREESSIPRFKFSRDHASEQLLVSSTAFGTVDQLVQHRPNETGKLVVTKTNKMVSQKEDEAVFETFHHRSGKEFQCFYQAGERMHFDDWGSKAWQPFPMRWYNEGLLVTTTKPKDDSQTGNSVEQGAGASSQGQSSKSQGRSRRDGADDRAGFLMHPTRGRIPTYILYKKHNVHMYFDKETDLWVRMPIAWELHHNMLKSLVDQVNESIPTWSDRHDILSLLRACNYDPDECISIYINLQKDQWMKGPKTAE
ncbi:hypothetical protein MAR_012683 [Mya arenaria]|uniref:Uncharacterized protein n=1 Tax=Mya arenaria TaxID=6604 RepID=A0ABY7G0Q1_MYAAR|nr:hypothetical protein MAR_012683 [Mya arenaria]